MNADMRNGLRGRWMAGVLAASVWLALPAVAQESVAPAVEVRTQLDAIMPEGVTIEDVQLADRSVSITGTAPSDAAVARLLRNLEGAATFEQPSLTLLRAGTRDGVAIREFSVSVQRRP